jgi:YfiH family protein
MPYLYADWPIPATIHALTSLRTDGHSQGVFNSFNLGYHVDDNPDQVAQNINKLVKELALPYTPHWISQVHGCDVVESEQILPETKADGVYTHEKGQICAVLTADCLPILIAHPQGLGVAALHGGWRSLQQGIIEVGLNKLDLPRQELFVWLGPAIGPTAFAIGLEVRDAFLEKFPFLSNAFYQDDNMQWHADLYQIARLQLQQCGVNHIYGGNYCTYSDKERFYSFRRDQQTGRMASLIWIDKDTPHDR